MSILSDQLLVYTILTYAVAMLAYAIEYALGSRGTVVRIASRQPARSAAPVGVGAVTPVGVDADSSGSSLRGLPTAGVARLAGRAAVAFTGAGWLLHASCLVTRGFADRRVPWGNMYEFILAVCLVGTTAWLVLLTRRPYLRPIGLYVTLVVPLLLGIDGMLLYSQAGPLVPALNSYWLKIHVTAAITASGIFLVGFVAATMTLIRAGYEAGRNRYPYSLGDRLPSTEILEQMTFRIHALAFPIWTFAVICGAIWAEAAWGRYWGWDPKEVWSFIAWVIYAGYLHARATPSVKRTVVTWIAVLGWATMMVNLFGVNLFIAGLHSYAGVK